MMIVRPSSWNCADLVQALLLELLVADRQHLVDQEDVGIGVHGDGERETDVHTGRVELHLRVDEVADARELEDVVEVGLGLLAAQSEHGRVQVDVLAARQVGVEPGAEFEEGRDPAALPHLPDVGWMIPPTTLRSVLLPDPL